jgi:two-component system sensor histidine kinase BarA
MSYRAFKRLFGETNLERKCRFLLGAGTLLLVTASFMLHARLTEHLAYDQTVTTSRLLVDAIFSEVHLEPGRRDALLDLQHHREMTWPKALDGYRYSIIKPNARRPENQASPDELPLLKKFLAEPEVSEDSRLITSQQTFQYYAALRARKSCLGCHPLAREREEFGTELHEGDLMAVVRIGVPIKAIEEGVHINRALLISVALFTAILIMAGTYLLIRYVVVKPVKHFKEVSDAIAAGELNVRSEIQTGDEFEDLSHAFNRMLRNLVNMQERLKTMNSDLDRKVDELARLNLALYESNRLKGDFLATMSHELRTPLNSILGFSEVLLSGDKLSDRQTRWVTNIQTSGHNLLNLINDILDLAKIEAGKMQLRPEVFELSEVTDGLVSMFRPLAEKKNLDLRAVLLPGIPVLRQDPGKLRQVLQNLLSNAVKFTPDGGRVTLRAEREGDRVVIAVSDTGVGIAAEDQEVIFEKFRQAANPMTREHAGTGLGLSIVRELANLLQGEVTLTSELGRGSTFTVKLPLTLREEPKADVDAAAGLWPTPDGVNGIEAFRAAMAQFTTAAAKGPEEPAPSPG